MLPSQRAPWSDPRVLALLLMVFLLGAVSGALTMRTGLHSRLHRANLLWRSDQKVTYEQLKTELKLTPDQAAKLTSILDDMVKYRQDMDAEVESFRATGRNRILEMLTPEQRKRFEELSASMNGH